LASRDARRQHQLELLREHPAEALVCLTVIMPGAEKRNALSLAVARAACDALRAAFPGAALEVRDLSTGFEAYLLTSLPPLEAKRIAVRIEDTHPLGRLFDVDVIVPSRSASEEVSPVSRAAVGSAPRRCLLCDNEARFCMRQHTHTQEELMARIREMVEEWGERHRQ
ncbi:MAG: citrate lyase holo-[Alloprevotella sp.]|nr:citrate lyase holo-[acyl-carrier protein] synthase [Alloprevotella sp.]